jgi:hypothetical protein
LAWWCVCACNACVCVYVCVCVCLWFMWSACSCQCSICLVRTCLLNLSLSGLVPISCTGGEASPINPYFWMTACGCFADASAIRLRRGPPATPADLTSSRGNGWQQHGAHAKCQGCTVQTSVDKHGFCTPAWRGANYPEKGIRNAEGVCNNGARTRPLSERACVRPR